jgi:propanol-preferring alcohol dehydrogenase
MKAVRIAKIALVRTGAVPVKLEEIDAPQPGPEEVRIAVSFCGVCHTELDEIEGRSPPPELPVVPGHEVVGVIDEVGPGVTRRSRGERVGVGWIHSSCGECGYCRSGRENLCPEFRATGRDVNGGYAEYMTVPERFCYPIPAAFGDAEAAPLLCAGGVGYRALRLAGIEDGMPLGFTGFGASAHLVLQLARRRYPASPLYVFTRREEKRSRALDLGADWAGSSADAPPAPPAAVIDTTPAWQPVIRALRTLAPAGRLVINAIRKEEADKSTLQELSYEKDLWAEKELKSVANVTPADIAAFLDEAAEGSITPEITVYPLEEAARALAELKEGRASGAKVLQIHS